MSIVQCTWPDHKGDNNVDTDFHEVMYLSGKRHNYVICEDCTNRAGEVAEMLDDLDEKDRETQRFYAGSIKALVAAQTELKTVYDAAKQALKRQGMEWEI